MQKDEIKRVCIIAPYDYTIPAVDGGALEQIVEGICNVNEIRHRLDITVLATYSPLNTNVDYKHTKFIYFKKKIFDRQWYWMFRAIKKVLHIYIPASKRLMEVKKWIKTHSKEYDFLVYEDGLTYMLEYLFKDIDKEKVINHLHWVGDPDDNSNKYISKLLPVSDYVGKTWIEKTGDILPCITVKNGVDALKYARIVNDKEKSKIKNSLNILPEDFVILYIGRIIEEKGVLQLVQAVNELNDIKIKLIVIGSAHFNLKTFTGYEKEVLAAVSKGKNILLLGYKPNEELYKYQSVADIAIMPSICEESAGLSAIECMSAGLPLIVTKSGGLVEYIDDETCLVVEKDLNLVSGLKAAIIKMMKQRDSLHQKGQHAKQVASKYSIDNMYENFVDAIAK